MATWSDIQGIGTVTAAARRQAASALREGADALAIAPTALTAEDYRAFRASRITDDLPSALAINLLFGGWQRACEYTVKHVRGTVEIEDEVARTLYGDPTLRRRVYETHKHASPAI